MKKESIYILEDRGIIYINGDDAFNYLQNIISNDLKKSFRYSELFFIFINTSRKVLI